ncbi:MAG: EamA family transporter [Clostridia bacterium]|nr:EamA family transporter [Clostridia bacterium]
MPLLITVGCMITGVIQGIFKKQYNLKCQGGQITFCTSSSLFALFFFIIITPDIHFGFRIVPYSVLFAIVYSAAIVFNILAIQIGSFALTTLVRSYSLIIPTVDGLLYLNEKIDVINIAGILSLLLSLILIRQKVTANDQKKVSFRWVIYLIIGFITNGACSVVQNEQRRAFHNVENGNFMILSLCMCFLLLTIVSVLMERKWLRMSLQKGIMTAALCGISNGATNWLVMVAISMISASVFFPILSAGQMILTYLISVLFYHEKFIPRQKIGMVFGMLSLILLNL